MTATDLQSFRALEFLGDLWAGEGDAERARSYYEQALEKRPDNDSIREKLEGSGS